MAFPNGLPELLSRLGGVAHYHGTPVEPEKLEAVNPTKADAIVVLAEHEHNAVSDSRTFDILDRLRELQVKGLVLAECVDDRNRGRLLKAGAQVVTRPIRAYPGMIVRGLVSPGAELFIEEMIQTSGSVFRRFPVLISGILWRDILCHMITNDIGTAIAYVDKEGRLNTTPPPDEVIEASALLLIVREGNHPSLNDVELALVEPAQ